MAGKKWSPEQTEKFKATMKLKAKEKANGAKKSKLATDRQPQSHQADIPAATLAYAMGRTEAWIEGYATSERVSAATLAFRMGQLLQRKARG
jgi:hypothetical protein